MSDTVGGCEAIMRERTDGGWRMHRHRAGMTLTEVLIGSTILAAIMAGGLVLSNAVTETSGASLTARSLTQDARYALTTIRDDLNVISRAGSLIDTENPDLGFQVDLNRSESIVLSLTYDDSPHDNITYYLDGRTLYRAYRNTLTPLALNVTSFDVTIDDPRISIDFTLERNGQTHHHTISGRFKNP